MADAQDLENDLEQEVEGGSKKLIIIIAAVVLLIGGGVAAFFLLGGSDEPDPEGAQAEQVEEVKEPAIYVGVPNAITARLPSEDGRSRMVQVKMSFMVRGEEAKKLVKTHMPKLKNDVLMMMSEQTVESLRTPEGRRKLQEMSLKTVQESMQKLVGAPTVEKVLFVSFVMQ